MRGRNLITETGRTDRVDLYEDEDTRERVRVTLDDALRELQLPKSERTDEVTLPLGPSLHPEETTSPDALPIG